MLLQQQKITGTFSLFSYPTVHTLRKYHKNHKTIRISSAKSYQPLQKARKNLKTKEKRKRKNGQRVISTFSPFSGAISNSTPLIHNLSHIKGFSTLSAPKLSTKTVQITRHKLPKTTLKYTKEKSINKQKMEYIHKVHKPN